MNAKEQIQIELAEYFKENNITNVEQGLNDLQSTLTSYIISHEGLAENTSKEILAWTALQIAKGSTRRYKDLVVQNTGTVDIEFIQSIKTKRFLYEILTTNILHKNGCFGVLGSRYVGKTILLQQLYCDNIETASYLDCSFLQYNSNFSFSYYYSSVIKEDKHIVLLDEVCKINSNIYLEFIHSTKLYSAKLCIIITGSVQLLVDNICNEICRGKTFVLPPFFYIEKLCWLHEIESIQLQPIKQFINKDTLSGYLKNQFMSNDKLLSYTKGVVHDTITSYRDNTILEGDITIDDKTLNNALKYISLCQVIYHRSSDNNFNNIPNIEPELRGLIFKGDYEAACNKWYLKKQDIEKVISLLACSNLIHKVANMKELDNTEDAYIFEYPWYTSYCLSPSIQDSDVLLNMWVEYSILLRASYIYSDVAKYRNIYGDEIDIVYKINNWYGLEIKNRPKSNINNNYTRKLNKLSKDLSLSELLISDEDINPVLVAILEFEYIQIIYRGNCETNKSIQTLLNEFRRNK